MATKGTFYGWDFNAFDFNLDNGAVITDTENGPGPGDPLEDPAGNPITGTMTIDTAESFYSITIDDDTGDGDLEDGFNDTDGSESQTVAALSEGATSVPVNVGDTVEIEYSITLRPPGGNPDESDDIKIYALAVGPNTDNNNPTVMWLSDAELDTSLTYTIIDSLDGDSVPYVDLYDEICFVVGTQIETDAGLIAVEKLREGDLVATKDNGYQPIRWIGQRTRTVSEKTCPITITVGALGNTEDLCVSPQHRILVSGWRAELLFGVTEILVPAKALVNGDTIYQQSSGSVTYVHFMCDRHEIVYANGVEVETLFAGDMAMASLSQEAREEIFDIFPELRSNPAALGSAARPIARVQDGRAVRLH
ncbi:MAG: Hint domain-containing protein [Pseudomonadota bacterium]